jgi:X-X-X-Leu-X-X-Gly heptad repeat protein
MNKTLLLIICDFLLLNLLALTRWDTPAAPEPHRPTSAEVAVAADRAATADLVASMKAALEDERAVRDQSAAQWKSNLTAREVQLAALEEQHRQATTNLVKIQSSALELSEQLAKSAQTAAQTQQRLADAQQKLTESERARGTLADNLKAAEAERKRLADSLAGEKTNVQRQQEALAAVEAARRAADQRVAELAAAVKVAEAEKTLLRDNVVDLKQQVGRAQQEKDRLQAQTAALASGVNQLAARSEELKQELKQEIHDSVPINANLVFNDFLSNRVQVAVGGVGAALIGSGQKQKDSSTVIVTDGARTAVLLHLNDTPLSLGIPGFGMDRFGARVATRAGELAAGPVELLAADPRVVAVGVDAAAAAKSGARVFLLAKNPYKFTEAVLVSRGGKYYGEVEFRLDARTPNYVRMKTKILSRLFGEFSPSAGDLVLAKTGEVLGVMANGEYCLVVRDLTAAAGGIFDPAMTRAVMGKRLEEFKAAIDRLPAPLQ